MYNIIINRVCDKKRNWRIFKGCGQADGSNIDKVIEKLCSLHGLTPFTNKIGEYRFAKNNADFIADNINKNYTMWQALTVEEEPATDVVEVDKFHGQTKMILAGPIRKGDQMPKDNYFVFIKRLQWSFKYWELTADLAQQPFLPFPTSAHILRFVQSTCPKGRFLSTGYAFSKVDAEYVARKIEATFPAIKVKISTSAANINVAQENKKPKESVNSPSPMYFIKTIYRPDGKINETPVRNGGIGTALSSGNFTAITSICNNEKITFVIKNNKCMLSKEDAEFIAEKIEKYYIGVQAFVVTEEEEIVKENKDKIVNKIGEEHEVSKETAIEKLYKMPSSCMTVGDIINIFQYQNLSKFAREGKEWADKIDKILEKAQKRRDSFGEFFKNIKESKS